MLGKPEFSAYCACVKHVSFFLKKGVCFFFSTKQNLLEELDGLQSDLTALKLKNEELKVSHHDYTQEVCIIF